MLIAYYMYDTCESTPQKYHTYSIVLYIIIILLTDRYILWLVRLWGDFRVAARERRERKGC